MGTSAILKYNCHGPTGVPGWRATDYASEGEIEIAGLGEIAMESPSLVNSIAGNAKT